MNVLSSQALAANSQPRLQLIEHSRTTDSEFKLAQASNLHHQNDKHASFPFNTRIFCVLAYLCIFFCLLVFYQSKPLCLTKLMHIQMHITFGSLNDGYVIAQALLKTDLQEMCMHHRTTVLNGNKI